MYPKFIRKNTIESISLVPQEKIETQTYGKWLKTTSGVLETVGEFDDDILILYPGFLEANDQFFIKPYLRIKIINNTSTQKLFFSKFIDVNKPNDINTINSFINFALQDEFVDFKSLIDKINNL